MGRTCSCLFISAFYLLKRGLLCSPDEFGDYGFSSSPSPQVTIVTHLCVYRLRLFSVLL